METMKVFKIFLTMVLAWNIPSAGMALENHHFQKNALPFLKTHCLRCHDEKQQKGSFRLDNLSTDFSVQKSSERWAEVLFRINSGEMPPKKEPQPNARELQNIVEWISTNLQEGEAARLSRRGPVSHYRLSREEYGHTVLDLLGVYFDVKTPGAFNEDARRHGIDRLGALLTLSPSHMERYQRAAELVLNQAFPAMPPKAEIMRKNVDDGKWRDLGMSGPERWLLWPDSGRTVFTLKTPGRYRIRIQASGLASFKGRPPHLAIWHHGLKRSITGQDIIASENNPSIIEMESFLPDGTFSIRNESPGMFSDGHTLGNTQFTFRSIASTPQKIPTGYQLFSPEGKAIYPTLMVDWVEFEGPILSETEKKKREDFQPPKNADLALARNRLERFASTSWRRPATLDEITRYVQLIESEIRAGASFSQAYQSAMVAILTSKNFMYIQEGEPAKKREMVTEWELASRLSYFLWNSMPDDDLFASARAGKLKNPEELRYQVSRMLKDPKAGRFTDSFPKQWLQLHRVGQFPPDTELYPDYDRWLERSMVLETTIYFDTVFRENLSIREFLLSDWTILNPRLAMHYGLPPLQTTMFQRVKLQPGYHRGGVLTHASVLSLTSDGTRHRPVHRGVLVSEAIFGRTPPPPPPNVEPLEPTPINRPKATIRQQLEAHTTHSTCAACHQRIDPLGFAFDHYDAIGRWRTSEKVSGGSGGDPPVQSGGTLQDGRKFGGPEEFKNLLAQDLDHFAEAFIEQLATYALRRVMTPKDIPFIKEIALASKPNGYPLQTLIQNLANSPLFQIR